MDNSASAARSWSGSSGGNSGTPESSRKHFTPYAPASSRAVSAPRLPGTAPPQKPTSTCTRPAAAARLTASEAGSTGRRQAVQRHVEDRRDPAGRCRRGGGGEALPLGPAGLVDVHVRVDQARQQHGVVVEHDRPVRGQLLRPRRDRGDPAAGDADPGRAHRPTGEHPAGRDDQVHHGRITPAGPADEPSTGRPMRRPSIRMRRGSGLADSMPASFHRPPGRGWGSVWPDERHHARPRRHHRPPRGGCRGATVRSGRCPAVRGAHRLGRSLRDRPVRPGPGYVRADVRLRRLLRRAHVLPVGDGDVLDPRRRRPPPRAAAALALLVHDVPGLPRASRCGGTGRRGRRRPA